MAVAGIGVIVALVARFRMVATNNTLFLVLANKFASVTFLALAARLVVQDD